MKQFTDITVLLDRSGSMSAIKEAMETAFNKFIQEHKAVPSTKVTLVQFDDINPYDVVFQSVPVTAVEKLDLRPRGNTPLLDSLCQTIDTTGRRYAGLPEAERPDQVLLVVITDGQENASRAHTRQDVFKRVTNQKDNFKWEFVYLGANHDAFAEGARLGFDRGKTMWYDVNRVDPAIMSLMSNTVAYADTKGAMRGTAAASAKLDFNDEQLKSAKDDLSAAWTVDSTKGTK